MKSSSPFKTLRSSPFTQVEGGVNGANESEKVVKTNKESKDKYNLFEGKENFGSKFADFMMDDNPAWALMNFIPFGGVAGKSIGKTKFFQNLIKKVPGLNKLFKSGKTITENQKIDFQKGFGDSLKAKGGVSNNYSNLPSNAAQHNTAIDVFDKYRRGVKTKFKDKVSEAYEKVGKTVEPRYFKSPQNMMDQFPLEERLKYLSKSNIKDDWLFRGGVTKKGGKYFDVDGIEIPLDPKVNYIPPSLKDNIK